MTPYLSDEWLSAAAESVAGLEPVDGALSVAVTVTDGPNGDRSYRMLLGPDQVTVDDQVDSATATMALAWADAAAIAQGQSSAQRAFLDGRLRIGGDVSSLLGHQEAMAAFDDRLATLRATTSFD